MDVRPSIPEGWSANGKLGSLFGASPPPNSLREPRMPRKAPRPANLSDWVHGRELGGILVPPGVVRLDMDRAISRWRARFDLRRHLGRKVVGYLTACVDSARFKGPDAVMMRKYRDTGCCFALAWRGSSGGRFSTVCSTRGVGIRPSMAKYTTGAGPYICTSTS